MMTVNAFSPLVHSTATSYSSSSTTQLAATLAPNQIKLLRKEAAQRLARQSLAQVFLPSDDMNGDDDTTTMTTIVEQLQQHELVQVRGISRDNIRNVYAASQQLALELSLLSTTTIIHVVETTGHSSILYAPATPPQLTLRTSYKEGQWTKKRKQPRDERGQIIIVNADVQERDEQ